MQTAVLVSENDKNTLGLLTHRLSEVGFVCNVSARFKDNPQDFISVFIKTLSQSDFVIISAPFKYSKNLAEHLNLNLKASKKAIDYIDEYCKKTGQNPILYKEKVIIPQGSAPINGENGNVGFILKFKDKTIVFLSENPDEVEIHTVCGILSGFSQKNTDKIKSKVRNKKRLIFDFDKKLFIFAILGIVTVFLFAGICLALKNGGIKPLNENTISESQIENVSKTEDNTSKNEPSMPVIIMTGEALEDPHESMESEPSEKEESSSSKESSKESSQEITQQPPSSSKVPDLSVPDNVSQEPPSSSQVPVPPVPDIVPQEPPVFSSEPSSSEPQESSQDDAPMEFVMDDEQLEKDKLLEEQLEREQMELEENSKNQEQDGNDYQYESESTDADYDEILYIRNNGRIKEMNAYDLVLQAVQSETHGCMSLEALKAQAVATYTFIKYNNKMGVNPTIGLLTPVSQSVKKAVNSVFGQACYYNGRYINAVYHSTSGGKTTSSRDVWGGSVPYLVSVDSDWDKDAPKYHTVVLITADNFYDAIVRTYGIYPEGDKSEWIEVNHDADGDYAGTVTVSGYNTSQGGTVADGKKITGRNIREQLMGFTLRSHCFDVTYDESTDKFRFDVYGYGHGVGLSQYGADFMAKDGYDYKEILEHYYSGIEIK